MIKLSDLWFNRVKVRPRPQGGRGPDTRKFCGTHSQTNIFLSTGLYIDFIFISVVFFPLLYKWKHQPWLAKAALVKPLKPIQTTQESSRKSEIISLNVEELDNEVALENYSFHLPRFDEVLLNFEWLCCTLCQKDHVIRLLIVKPMDCLLLKSHVISSIFQIRTIHEVGALAAEETVSGTMRSSRPRSRSDWLDWFPARETKLQASAAKSNEGKVSPKWSDETGWHELRLPQTFTSTGTAPELVLDNNIEEEVSECELYSNERIHFLVFSFILSNQKSLN